MRIEQGPPRARKRFGQHFLEPAWVAKVVRAIAPAPEDTFLEIGPGRGALTRPLAPAAHRVVAFEIDRDLAAHLREQLAGAASNVTIVDGDFLATKADDITGLAGLVEGGHPLRVAGNLPYNVAAPIMFHLLDLFAAGIPVVDATLMLQREVADRLVAPPGTRDYGVLSVLVGHRAAVERLMDLPAGAFRPPPKVKSTLVRLRFHAPQPPARDDRVFREVVQAIFTRRRKTLANALLAHPRAAARGAHTVLRTSQLDGSRRPETLDIFELVRLADALVAAPAERLEPPPLPPRP